MLEARSQVWELTINNPTIKSPQRSLQSSCCLHISNAFSLYQELIWTEQCHSQCVLLAALRGKCCPSMFLHSFWGPFWQQGQFMVYTMVRAHLTLTFYILLISHLEYCTFTYSWPNYISQIKLYLLSILFPFADAIYDYCGGNLTVNGVRATAGIFATYPAPYLSLLGGFIDQVDWRIKGLQLQITIIWHILCTNPFLCCVVLHTAILTFCCDVCAVCVCARCLAQLCCCCVWLHCPTRGTNRPQQAVSLSQWVSWCCSLAFL